MSKFDHTNPQELPPEVDILFMGRRRVTRKFLLGANNSIVDAVYASYGEADPAVITSATTGYANLRLIQQKVLPSVKAGVPSTLIQVFETITDALAPETTDVIDFELNGLKRTTRQLIGSTAADISSFVVGTQSYGSAPVQYLASVKIEQTEAFTRVNAVYLQAGVLSKSRSAGEITGTISNSWTVWYSDPLPLMTAALGTVVPTADRTENVQGYPVRTVTALSGTITGLKTSYKTVSEVRTPGVITPLTQTSAITTGNTVAYLQVVPPRTKTIPVTVEVSITTTPPNAAEQLAYNLENVSASATSITETYHGNGTRDLKYGDGTIGFRGSRYSVSLSVNESSYPSHTYGAASATGVITYNSDWSDTDGDATDNTIVAVAQSSVVTTKIACSGSSVATGYFTSGVLQRKARPILTDLNGVQYWEVVTFIA